MRTAAQLRLQPGASPLHLYRHLLREAGYLPPLLAPYIISHIKRRFHRQHDHRHYAGAMDRAVAQKQQGRRHLHHLESANAGHAPALRRVFSHVFAKTGKLARERTPQIVLPGPGGRTDEAPPPPYQNGPEKLGQSLPTPRSEREAYFSAQEAFALARKNKDLGPDYLDRWDSKKLLAYMTSQKAHAAQIRPHLWTQPGPNTSEVNSLVPRRNSWGRTTPIKSARSKLKKWLKKTMPRLCMPLLATEWETLRTLATSRGELPLLQLRARRPVAVSAPTTDGETGGWEWKNYARHKTSHLVRQQERFYPSEGLLQIAGQEKPCPKGKMKRKLHRQAVVAYEQSSLVQVDEKISKEKFIWGRVDKELGTIFPTCGLFDGVDMQGGLAESNHS